MEHINRRTMLSATAAAAASTIFISDQARADCPSEAKQCPNQKGTQMADGYKIVDGVKVYDNSYFYDADGKFLAGRAKDAYMEMFDRFGYPYPKGFRDNAEFWVLEGGIGDFAHVGMGGIIWLNRNEPGFSYFGHDIYLLPFQMIPEHSHHPTKYPAKMESWHVRYGSIYNFAEVGEDNRPFPVPVPESQQPFTHLKHYEELHVGDISHLAKLESWHCMMGGPQGAIVTEYANFHDGDGLRFANPKVSFC